MPLELQYHDLRPDKGLYYTLERQGRAERIVTEAAIYQPPHDTRAYLPPTAWSPLPLIWKNEDLMRTSDSGHQSEAISARSNGDE